MKKRVLMSVIAMLIVAVRVVPQLEVALDDGTTSARLVTIAPDEILAAGNLVITSRGAPLSITDVSVAGDDAGVFILGPIPSEVAPSGSATVTITFRPAGREGVFGGRFVVTSPGDVNEEVIICARATTEPGAIGSLAPTCSPPRSVQPPVAQGCSK